MAPPISPHFLRKRFVPCLFVFLAAAMVTPATGMEPDLTVLRERLLKGPHLSDLVSYAYQKNPAIQGSKAKWHASLEQIRVDGAYPDPQLSMTYWPESAVNDLDEKKIEVMLSQTLPFPGKLDAAEAAAQAEARINRINLDRSVRDVVAGVRESFYELAYIRKAQRIGSQNEELIVQLRAMGESAYAADRASLIDVLKAQSQAAQTGYDILLLKELEQTEITRLNGWLNREKDAAIGPLAEDPLPPVVFSLDEIDSLAGKNRQEIQIATAGIEKSTAQADMARYENRPEFMLGLLYEENAPGEPGASREEMYGLQVGMTLPLWFGKNNARKEAAKAGIEEAKAMAQAARNDTRSLVHETFFRLKNAERLMTLYRDHLIPQAQKSMETAETWSRQGAGSLSDYTEIQSVWYNFQLAFARSQADYGKYLSRLESLAGQRLTTQNPPEAGPK